MSETTFIYALKEPINGNVRYIGKADNPENRLYHHLLAIKWEKNHKANWIKSLVANGQQPILEIIDEVLHSEWQAAEAAYIAFFKDDGCNLVNMAHGGEGYGAGEYNPNYRKTFPSELRAKLSMAKKGENNPFYGKKHSTKTCAKMSLWQKGKKHSLEHCANMRAAVKGEKSVWFGKKHTAESRAKMSAILKGRTRSPESCQRMRVAQKGHIGKKHTPEELAKMSAANKGKKRSAEACARIKAAKQDWWNKEKERRWIETCFSEMWN